MSATNNSSLVFEIESPPPDVELGFARKPLRYLTALPSAGIGDKTGAILFLCPWGMLPEHDYCRNVLLPRLADQYDCVVAAPSYFGIGVKSDPNATLIPPDGFSVGVRQLLGDEVGRLPLLDQLRALAEAGLTELPVELAFSINPFPEYQSFGFMPALDTIAVLADLLRRFPLRRDRLHCIGSSYGGYVACLLLKMLPNTFHVIIENSGFVSPKPQEMSNIEYKGFNWLPVNGLSMPVFHVSPWTFADPASPGFVGPGVLAIRTCTAPNHYDTSKTLMRSYHSTQDSLIPIASKRAFWAELRQKMTLRSVEVREDMIDGRLFKTLAHGMDASMIELMADGMRDTPDASPDALTDFDRQTVRSLQAGDRSYIFRFAADLTFQVEIR